MTDGERSFKEKLALRIVHRKIDSIFDECSKFEEKDKRILFEVIGNLLLQHMRQLPHIRAADTSTAADETPPKIREFGRASGSVSEICWSGTSDLPGY
jgi:hypothetical protein